MAESASGKQNTVSSGAEPVLRPGRPADPAALPAGPLPEDPHAGPEHHQAGLPVVEDKSDPPPEPRQEPPAGEPEAATDEETERRYAESRQRRIRRLLKQCERVTLMDFNTLAMPDWPDNYTVTMARRRRDSWLLCAVIAAVIFLMGMTGWVPAWLAGGGFGAFVVILLLGVPSVRRLYSHAPSYLDLLLLRRQLIRDARKHIAHLEGEVGLIWQFSELSEFNPVLSASRFSALRHLSEQRHLSASLARREHIRLYLIYLLEAEKAYERIQGLFFEGHQQALDRGWSSVARVTTGGEKPPQAEAPEAGAEENNPPETTPEQP